MAQNEEREREIGAEPRDTGRPHFVDHDCTDIALLNRQRRSDQVKVVDREEGKGSDEAHEVHRARDSSEHRPSTLGEPPSREEGRNQARERDEAEQGESELPVGIGGAEVERPPGVGVVGLEQPSNGDTGRGWAG